MVMTICVHSYNIQALVPSTSSYKLSYTTAMPSSLLHKHITN